MRKSVQPQRGTSPGDGPEGWDQARALELQAVVNARLDEVMASFPADKPHRQARLNVLANWRGIIAGWIAKRDPILWCMPDSLKRMLARWEEEDAAERRQQPHSC